MAVNISSLEGWDIAYSSTQQHEVGVIDPDLLPSKSLIYKYYFELNPQSTTGGTPSLGIAPSIDIATDYIKFDLDFVVSGPIWNQLIVATADNVSGDTLILPKHVLEVAYVFKVTLDSNGNIDGILDSNDANPVLPGTLPSRPSEDSGKDAWFQFYATFGSDGDWSSYNRFLSKEGSPDQDYTLEHQGTSNQTNSKRIKVKNLNIGDAYIISYEGIDEHLFRHHVDMTFETFIIVEYGINLTGSNMPWEDITKSRFAHYLWKEWYDDNGEFHEGWRVSETWNMNAPAHTLVDDGKAYDAVENPLSGTNLYCDWAMYNMNERNLKLKDSERIGYSKNYAEYLKTMSSTSSVANAIALAADTNEIDSSNVHSSNFELGYVADNIVNYSGGGYGIVEQGGATGVLFQAMTTQYHGFFLSNYYKRKFPKNTRMVSAYSRIRHGGNGRVIAVLMSKAGQYVSALQDPMFFMTIGDNLYFHYFDDNFTEIMMSSAMKKSADDIEYTGNRLLGVDSPLSSGTITEPGRTIFIKDNTDVAKTYIDDSGLSTSPSSSSIASVAEYDIVNGDISDVTDTFVGKPEKALKVFEISGMDSSSVVSSLRIKMNSNGNEQSAIVRIKGIGSQDKEMFSVSVPMGKDFPIDLGAWEKMSNLYIMSNVNCDLEYCNFIQLKSTIDINQHIVGSVTSMAASTDRRGSIMLFYTDKDGRLNLTFSSTQGKAWSKFENILMRGDEISDVKGIPNMEDDVFFIFHFYKDALLCVPMNITLFMLSQDVEKRTEALDTMRRQSCSLVWGNAIKPETEKITQIDSSGKHTVEDLNDNVIFTSSDEEEYQNYARSVGRINESDAADTSKKDISTSNKFIYIGKLTANEGLATSSPQSTNYCVYRSKRGVLRLFIEHEDKNGKSVFRNLNSYDSGLNWSDGWKYQKNDISSSDEHAVKLNYLSSGEDSEEGTNISVLYNDSQDTAYMFYFYLGAVLCKPIQEQILYMEDLDKQADLINSLPIYMVAGNVNSIIGESNYESLSAGETRSIALNSFQRNIDNITNYYSEEYYSEQPISGYCTKGGYMRIFLVNTNNKVDGYYFDGGFWMPDRAVLK